MRIKTALLAGAVAIASSAGVLADNRAGTIKTLRGDVTISRADQMLTAAVGDAVMAGDQVITGPVSFAGITLLDNTRMTAGPDSRMEIEEFSFDTTTHEGSLNTTVQRGTLSVVSGQLAKANPDSVRFNTGSMTLGVRGTEFIIEAAGE